MKVEEEQYEDDFEEDPAPQNDRYEDSSDPDSEFDENPLEESNS